MLVDELREILKDLALDLRWSWNHTADELWSQLEPGLWEMTRNAWIVLQTVSGTNLERICGEPGFQQKLQRVLRERRERAAASNWFGVTHPGAGLTAVAYFSMEFMLSEALPVYSGGLGNVAGDQLKAAGDLGVPVTGVGLLYQRGYFRQHIDAAGRQLEFYPFNEPGQLPIVPVRGQDGDLLRVRLELPGSSLWVRTWEARVGSAKLYLLDTNDPANLPEFRGITSELYGGGPEQRLQQEHVLGVAGWRLLRALGLNPEVCHLNEGHAAFAALERARDNMGQTGATFQEALSLTRAGNLFTTHTPVEAGFDRFPEDLMRAHMRDYAEGGLHIPFEDFMALGRLNPNDRSEPFNMAWLAVRTSGAINGVSLVHGTVSRKLFQPLFPRWPQAEVPVGHVTNGVHTATWDSAAADGLWTEACGKHRWRWLPEDLEEKLRSVPSADLWTMRARARKTLIEYVRRQLARQLAGNGAAASEIEFARHVFDPATLTIGFARRFATYKRPTLLLRDPERLLRILTNRTHPVQIVIAGKAHPRDDDGREMIRQWVEFAHREDVRAHAVFLADYDMQMSQELVQGVDLWLNTPRHPWEASGTSGMKVLVNGGLNLSELDGWWAEGYSPDLGWAIGDGAEHGGDSGWDDAEANQLYELLENRIVPDFYARDESGIPAAWVNRMRESMARLTPRFSANRVVREYTERYYLPAALSCSKRATEGGNPGRELVEWKRDIQGRWSQLRFGSLSVDSSEGWHRFAVQVYLSEMNPDHVEAELFAEQTVPEAIVRVPMRRGAPLPGSGSSYVYTASVETSRPAGDFTPRLIPRHPLAIVPLECAQILWYR